MCMFGPPTPFLGGRVSRADPTNTTTTPPRNGGAHMTNGKNMLCLSDQFSNSVASWEDWLWPYVWELGGASIF